MWGGGGPWCGIDSILQTCGSPPEPSPPSPSHPHFLFTPLNRFFYSAWSDDVALPPGNPLFGDMQSYYSLMINVNAWTNLLKYMNTGCGSGGR